MTDVMVPVPTRYLPERTEEKRREVEFLRTALEEVEGALGVAKQDLAELEAQAAGGAV